LRKGGAGYGESVEAEERERIIASSERVVVIAFGAVGALILTFFVALIVVGQLGGGLSYQDAYDRCLSTPPGLPCPCRTKDSGWH
jgi:hypothetical protein